MQINLLLFLNAFFWIFCCYSVSHCSNKPTLTIIDWSFICQCANIQNQQGIKYVFSPLYVTVEFLCVKVFMHHLWTVRYISAASGLHLWHSVQGGLYIFHWCPGSFVNADSVVLCRKVNISWTPKLCWGQRVLYCGRWESKMTIWNNLVVCVFLAFCLWLHLSYNISKW